jgi:hypothetical protein
MSELGPLGVGTVKRDQTLGWRLPHDDPNREPDAVGHAKGARHESRRK